MRGRLLIAVAVAACVTGCAQKMYYKAGATQQEFVTDKYSCNKDGTKASASERV